ncbi:MAG: hypothetical protein IBX55_16615 [Methyloprofundus sp.]|nr:hypothetical protein [Methyloprofundus sp.]
MNIIIRIIDTWMGYSPIIENPVFTSQLTLVFNVFIIVLVYPWQIIGLWRSANHYADEKNANFWPGLVKVIVVLGVIGTTGNLSISMPVYKDLYRIGFSSDEYSDYELKLSDDGRLIHLEGGIGFGLSKQFNQIIKRNPQVKGVVLDSTGGRLYEARELSKIILNESLDTYTVKGCYSACVVAFLSGNKRYLAEGAKLGFHQYSSGMQSVDISSSLISEQEKELAFFKRRGVSQRFLDKIFLAEPDEFWFPTMLEMLEAGVIHEVVSPSTLTPSEYSEIKVLKKNIEESFFDGLIQGFNLVSEKLNAIAPIMIDDETRLDRTAVEPRARMVYYYTLINFSSSDFDVDWVKTTLKPIVKQNVCETEDMKRSLQYGGTYTFIYAGNDVREIGRFDINRSDCGFSHVLD